MVHWRWKSVVTAVTALGVSGAALAQNEGLSVSAGMRAWYTQWSTFSYLVDANNNNIGLIQVSAEAKFVVVPQLSARYGNYLASLSVMPSTRFSFVNGDRGTRREYDLILGYSVLPGLNLTAGYKKISQRDGDTRYEPGGLVLGLSGSAPLAEGVSLYGSFGAGRLKTPQSGGREVVKFKTQYRLTELGLAYASVPTPGALRWTLSAGYRIQVMDSKEAFGIQDGRDTTQGFAFGALLRF